MLKELKIDTEITTAILTRFISKEIGRVGLKNAIVGLSGGVDSSLVAYLCVKAMGPERVFALTMPYKTSSKESLDHANLVADGLGMNLITLDITPSIDSYFKDFPDADKNRRGNKMARERMSILYDHSAFREGLVVGTSNKTELLLGYGTIYGDMASAINPVGDLYKTQVKQLAEAVGVPKVIIEKPPTADLWVDQLDESELGFTYDQADEILFYLVDQRRPREWLHKRFDEKLVDKIYDMIRRSQYKRRPPLIAKLSMRTIDRDFRYSRDWGV